MANTEYTLENMVNELSNIEQALLNPPTNSFNERTGDILHSIEFQLSRIADALEKIANK